MIETKAPSERILRNRLLHIVDQRRGTLMARVAQVALDYTEAETFFNRLPDRRNHPEVFLSIYEGLDGRQLFDRYYEDIEDIRRGFNGEIEIFLDLKASYAKFGVMQTVSKIAKQIGLEGL